MAVMHINLSAIADNLTEVIRASRQRGAEVVGVVKPCLDYMPIVDLFDEADVDYLGMSKLSVIRTIRSKVRKPVMLVSMPPPTEATFVVETCDVSLVSELRTVEALCLAAQARGRRHGMILMVDVGDLREGVLVEQVIDQVGKVLSLVGGHCYIEGIGANYACANGVLPTRDNLCALSALAGDIEAAYGVEIRTVSVGGSSIIDWWDGNALPSRINQVRIGQSVLLGTIPGRDGPHPRLSASTMVFEANIVELKEKPTRVDNSGVDAFGDRINHQDLGWRRRAILDFGVSDTDPRALVFMDRGLRYITSNSDYTLIDVTECERTLRVGDKLSFGLGYRSMLQAFVSPFVEKRIVQ